MRYVDGLSSVNFIPLSILPTHCVNDCHSTIDHVFSNFGFGESVNCNISSLTVTADITNHFANIVSITPNRKRTNYCDRPCIQLFSSKNIQNFQDELSRAYWSPIL